MVFDCDCESSPEFNGLFLLHALWCPKLVFHWSAGWLSWPPLWWGVISFQNFRTLKLWLYFCIDFLASSELIGYVDLTDSYEIQPKYSLVINAQECVRLFWFSKYFMLCSLMWRRSANIQFANFKIDFLSNQSEYGKSLAPFCWPSDREREKMKIVRFLGGKLCGTKS